MLAAKYKIAEIPTGDAGSFRILGAGYWGRPLTDYTPDFQPLSIGLASRRLGLRSTVEYRADSGWFVNASGAYTWRGGVTLDRPYYYTNNQLFLTNKVDMPRVVDYSTSAGYRKTRDRMAQFTFSKSITQGGVASGDIRRQDLPFVANRFIYSRVGGAIMYPVPFVPNLCFQFEYNHVIDGRNVGQSSTYTAGLLTTQSFKRRSKTK